jgi:hypothetical protein
VLYLDVFFIFLWEILTMAWNVKLDMNKYEQFYLNLEQEFSFNMLW